MPVLMTDALAEAKEVRAARRWTVAGLAMTGALAVLLSLLFFYIWRRSQDAQESVDPAQLELEGLALGLYVQAGARRSLDEFVNERMGQAGWNVAYPPRFVIDMRGLLDQRRPGPRPERLALFSRVDQRPGAILAEVLEPGSTEALTRGEPAREELGVRVRVLDVGESMRVEVEADLISRRDPSVGFVLRCSASIKPRPVLGSSARRTYLRLFIGFFALLYATLLAVYILARRQIRLAYSAKEKEIRLRSIGAVAEGIAHEVRNPLNAISLMLQFLERMGERRAQPPGPGDYERLYFELGKIRKVMDNFVGFTKLREIELSTWDLRDAVDEVLSEFAPTLKEVGVQVERDMEGDLRLAADRRKLVSVLRSLIQNAIDAMRESEDRILRIESESEKRFVVLNILDTGEGLADHALANMFDPYYSTRSTSMGLGLTLAKTVVEAHGGQIRADRSGRGGCLVTLEVPRRF